MGVTVAAVAVIGHRGVADKVVTENDVGVEVAVIGDAGIDHRHYHAAAVVGVPGRFQVDAACRLEIVPLLAVAAVTGHGRMLHQAVQLYRRDTGLAGQQLPQLFQRCIRQVLLQGH